MLIVNGYGFQGNPATDPQLLHGSLNPATQYNDSTLLAAAIGTMYVSRLVTTDANCTVLSSSACLWVKVQKDADCCGGLGSPKDWRRCCCFSLLEGTSVPNGATDPWCGAQTGDYYLQHTTTCGDHLWLKIHDGCAASDWIMVNRDPGFMERVSEPDPNSVLLTDADLAGFGVGSIHNVQQVTIDYTNDTCYTMQGIFFVRSVDCNFWLGPGNAVEVAATPNSASVIDTAVVGTQAFGEPVAVRFPGAYTIQHIENVAPGASFSKTFYRNVRVNQYTANALNAVTVGWLRIHALWWPVAG